MEENNRTIFLWKFVEGIVITIPLSTIYRQLLISYIEMNKMILLFKIIAPSSLTNL